MGEDKYTHSSFTLLQTTEQIRAVVDHALRQPESDVAVQLRRDLVVWRDGDVGDRKSRVPSTGNNVEEISSTISFDLIKRAHKQLEKTPLGINTRTAAQYKTGQKMFLHCMYAETGHVYLHDLVSGSRLVLPSLLPPPRVRPYHNHHTITMDDDVIVCCRTRSW